MEMSVKHGNYEVEQNLEWNKRFPMETTKRLMHPLTTCIES